MNEPLVNLRASLPTTDVIESGENYRNQAINKEIDDFLK